MSIVDYNPPGNGREEPTNTYVGMIGWEEGVAEATAMFGSFDPWRIAEIADLINPIYGAASMKKFVEATGINYSDLKKYRTTRKAWPVERGRPSYAVAQALNAHPNRYPLVAQNPNLTRDDARELMEMWTKDHKQAEATTERIEKRLVKSFESFLATDSKMQKDVERLRDSTEDTINIDLLGAIREAQARLAAALVELETRATTIDAVANEEPSANAKPKKSKKSSVTPPLQ